MKGQSPFLNVEKKRVKCALRGFLNKIMYVQHYVCLFLHFAHCSGFYGLRLFSIPEKDTIFMYV
ncbi:unnamed protein product [Ixodes pacificus]